MAGDRLVVDGRDCPGRGDLSGAPACRATVVASLAGRAVRAVRTVTDAGAVEYGAGTVALLVAADRFADAVAPHDGCLARLARREPLAAAARATARAGPAADLAAATGLAVVADHRRETGDPFRARPVSERTGNRDHPPGRPGDPARRE